MQNAGLNVTSVQNPLTTLPEAVASAERVRHVSFISQPDVIAALILGAAGQRA